MSMVSDGTMTDNDQVLQGLMSRQPVDHKGGAIIGRILQQLIYGVQQILETRIKIERIREAMNDFARQQNDGGGIREGEFRPKSN